VVKLGILKRDIKTIILECVRVDLVQVKKQFHYIIDKVFLQTGLEESNPIRGDSNDHSCVFYLDDVLSHINKSH
jgi:hypothetical protein